MLFSCSTELLSHRAALHHHLTASLTWVARRCELSQHKRLMNSAPSFMLFRAKYLHKERRKLWASNYFYGTNDSLFAQKLVKLACESWIMTIFTVLCLLLWLLSFTRKRFSYSAKKRKWNHEKIIIKLFVIKRGELQQGKGCTI